MMWCVPVVLALIAVPFTDAELARVMRMGPLPDLPADPTNAVADDEQAAGFGQELFFDTRFSRGGETSCATCHEPSRWFTDGRSLAEGEGRDQRHAPSLLNIAYQRWFFWDGRADTLWAQALHPFEQPAEFDTTRLDALRVLQADAKLLKQYEEIFGPLPDLSLEWDDLEVDRKAAITRAFSNLGKAIAAYERLLVTGPSEVDRFIASLLKDEATDAMSPPARRGLKLFVGEAGCHRCHSGPLLSDGEFHNIGIPALDHDLPLDSGRWDGLASAQANEFSAFGPCSDDPDGNRGRRTRSAIRSQSLWGAFKTPSIRTAAMTPPYMHQGQMATLTDVLAFYNTLEDQVRVDHHQESILVPLDLSEEDLQALEAFLRAAVGTMPHEDLLGPQ